MSKPMATATIRRAVASDVPLILQLIVELAEYEKETDSCKATEELLSASLGFKPGPDGTTKAYANTLLVFEDDGENKQKPVGLAIWFYNYSTWRARPGVYLEDLFVRPEFRGKGYGTALLAALAKEVIRVDGGRLEWVVLKWNTPSICFYESIGAKAMDDWQGMRVDGDNIEKLSRLGPAVNIEF